MSKPMEFTGERFTPECVREIWYEHFHRYVLAGELASGKRVLDAACGEGYGSAHLARTAKTVVGVDVSPQAIAHARERYQADNLEFQLANVCNLPFEDGQFECIVSFETLEHLEDQSGLLKEFRRVLSPGGFALISSPNKAIYTDRHHTENEFHVRELYRDELDALLDEQFPARRLLRQKLVFQSAIWSEEPTPHVAFHQSKNGRISAIESPGHEAMYYIAICAASEACLPELRRDLWLFDDAEESVYAHYHHEIRKNMSAGELLASLERQLEELKASGVDSPSESPHPRPWWQRLFRSS
ncbi:MAG: methyltransferase domain-containing protein [Proteobacteria bacterium]|nr:methyltransferase domain-containing protein [Pseudomonadota bacterium]